MESWKRSLTPARVGSMTMKIVDQYNLPDGDWCFSPVG